MATTPFERLAEVSAKAASSRRPNRDRRSDVEANILNAAERLLDTVPLQDLYVSNIISEAGISRATFYFYFSSKFAVLGALLARTAEDIFNAVQPWVAEGDGDVRERLRQSLVAAAAVWKEHEAVTRSAAEHWTTEPDIADLWATVVDSFTELFIELVERDRAAGAAPDGPDPRPIVGGLVWATERLFYIASTGRDPRIPDHEVAVDVLFRMWSSALYGAVAPEPPATAQPVADAAPPAPAPPRTGAKRRVPVWKAAGLDGDGDATQG
ncbi:TetR/AcrR family transcriptional regulator [Conexibacter sp. SYSU D00693]|uniref:TetR/AcrR family transcriptional regulator n=1 Tax=Conexibacter sp. SYSU D00693 TaxID=2812560 RepID=UPI00196AB0E1|nr:TetR/AcrR family transcriptional regulator [Conexibacter sp. SYSU D00693]